VLLFIRNKRKVLNMGDKNPKKMPKQKKTVVKPHVAPEVKAEPEVVKKAKKPV
jgi:hypothetical protein